MKSHSNRRGTRNLIIVLTAVAIVGSIYIGYRLSRNSPAAPQASAAVVPVVPKPSVAAAIPAAFTAPADPTPPANGGNPSTHPSTPMPDALAARAPISGTVTTPQTASPTTLLTRAHSELDANKLIDVRNDFNEALKSGSATDAQIADAKTSIAKISQSTVFGRQRFANDAYSADYVVKPGESLTKIGIACDCTWQLLGRVNGIDPTHLRAGATIKTIQGPFFAVITKSKFTMDIYLGGLPGEKSSMYVTTYAVGLGRDDSTPTGTWVVEPQRKLLHPTYYSPRGEGIIAADDPKNPLGGYWIGLSGSAGNAVGKLSYGIHGTIEPDSIGKQSSLGCIRLRSDDIAVVFDLMVEGKSLVIVRD